MRIQPLSLDMLFSFDAFLLLILSIGHLPQFIPLLRGLALSGIGAYLVADLLRGHERFAAIALRARYYLAFALIGLIVILPMLALIILRHLSAPQEYIHDGAIQIEEAVKFLLAGRNPYTADYSETVMARWQWDHPLLKVNPALRYNLYLPGMFLQAIPIDGLSQTLLGWFDVRLLHLPFFLLALATGMQFMSESERRLGFLFAFAFNPFFAPFFAEGRNDIVFLAWLILGIALLSRGHRSTSALALAMAVASKQTAWLVLPFYLMVFIPRTDWRHAAMWLKSLRALLPFCILCLLIFVPFLAWNPSAMLDSIWRFPNGDLDMRFDIKGYGIAPILVAMGSIPGPLAPFPFWPLQLIFGGLAFIWLARRFWKIPSVKEFWFASGVFLLVMTFFSRTLNDSILGSIIALLILSVFSDPDSLLVIND